MALPHQHHRQQWLLKVAHRYVSKSRKECPSEAPLFSSTFTRKSMAPRFLISTCIGLLGASPPSEWWRQLFSKQAQAHTTLFAATISEGPTSLCLQSPSTRAMLAHSSFDLLFASTSFIV
eukprot:c25306_g2_i1 orf=420-779(-)